MTAFTDCFAIIIGEEGGYTCNAADPGNWTSGIVNRGRLLGTKFGLSAASFPKLAIEHITLDQAQAIYKSKYWDPIAGDLLPPGFAFLAFDAAVNNGVGRAVRWMQAACGEPQDGVPGRVTLTAIRAQSHAALCTEFLARRLLFMASLPTWRTFGEGWARRLCGQPFDALLIAANHPTGD